MSFKIKNSQINNEALECLNSIIDEDINAGAAFKLTRILKFISTIVEDRVNLLNAENLIPFEKLEFSELGLKTAKIKDLLKIEFLFN